MHMATNPFLVECISGIQLLAGKVGKLVVKASHLNAC